MSRRQPGTGNWFLKSAELKAWLNTEGSSFWCPGIPGAGKTTMMGIVIDHLNHIFEHNDDVQVVYAFCDYRDHLNQNLETVLMSLWRHLMRKRVLETHECDSFEANSGGRNMYSQVKKAVAILRAELSRYKRVYILLDALDEFDLEQRADLMATLEDLGSHVNLLVTSRFMEADLLEKHGAHLLEISAMKSDIQKYISGRLRAERRLGQNCAKDPELEAAIAEAIIQKSRGM
jgi:Cdc6-like AAA superfamily ATPase